MSLRRLALAVILAAGLVPSPVAQAADTDADARRAGQSAELRASVHYTDAQRHADERIAFKPGGRVTVPYRPRPGNRWEVDGQAPQALPAGVLSGAEMAAAPAADATAQEPAPTASPSTASPPTMTLDGVPSPSASPASSGPHRAPMSWSGPSAERTLAAPVGGSGLRREVFGFLPYWELTDASTRLDYSVLSTIAYFGVGADKAGHLIRKRADGTRDVGWAGWTSAALTRVINEAHANRTRVVLTVQRFAWTSGQITATKALLGSPDARRTLASEIAAAVADRGADGVNLDFEPIPSGYGDEYVSLVRQVRRALDARAEGYQLTFDTTGSIGAYDIAALTADGAADAVFIMGYDYRTSGAANAGSVSPLAGPRYDLTDTIDAYLARISPSKVILGVPYYGRAWSTTSDALNARTRPGSAEYGYSSSVLYTTAVETAAKHGRQWDPTEASPWSVYRWKACADCPETWRQLYYDDVESLGRKYDLINARGLRGAGIWALGYDGTRPELYALLRTKFREDAAPPQAGVLLLPAVTRDASLRVRWTARDDTAVERYDVQVSVDGGAWKAWLDDTTRTAATYPASDGHGYAFRVRARDRKGNWSAWQVTDVWRASAGSLAVGAFARVTADSLVMRASADTSARKVGSLAKGARLRIVGGPRSRDGFTWHQVIAPLKEWGPVDTATRTAWVATASSAGSRVRVVPAPNTTAMDVLVDDLTMGAVDAVKATRAGSTGTPSKLPSAFSPTGDGLRDGLRLTYRLDADLDALALVVVRADGTELGRRTLPGLAKGAHAWDWDGKLGGERVADGAYLIQLVGKRGSVTASAPAPVMSDPTFDAGPWTATVDTDPPSIGEVGADPTAISPDGDGRQDRTTITARAGSGGVDWQVRVTGPDGATVRTWDGTGRDIAATWDGRLASGERAPDGTYGVEARVRDALGNAARASAQLVVDSTAPNGTVTPVVAGLVDGATVFAFSPDGDGWQDVVDLRVATGEPVKATVTVRDRSGSLVWSGSARHAEAPTVRWNGRDRDGGALKDGTYRLVAKVTDAAGNTATISGKVRLDRTAGFLRPSPGLFFPQDGDTLARSTRVTFELRGAATTSLRVLDAAGKEIRTAWKGRERPAGTTAWTWDGLDGAGAKVERGVYRLELVASAGGVTQVIRRTAQLDAFSVRPSSAEPSPGSRLTLTIRSAERLASAPRLTLEQPGAPDQSARASRLDDGRYRVTFTLASGITGLATVTIRATDVAGQVNTTSLELAVR